jgi:hypothetical protein
MAEQELKIYQVEAPDGSILKLEGPVGASQEDIIKNAEILFNQRQAQQPKYNMGAESLRSLAQGATFGSADEIEAALRTAPQQLSKEMQLGGLAAQMPTTEPQKVSLSDQMGAGLGSMVGTLPSIGDSGYKKTRDEIRARQQLFQKEHPVLSTGLEIAGGLAVPFIGAGGAALKGGTTLAGNIARGAGYGSLYGMGTAKEAKDMPLGAVQGATTGALFTGAVGALGRTITPKLSEAAKRLKEKGISLTPGQAIGGTLKQAEETGLKTPFVRGLFSGAHEKSIQDFNHVVIDEVLKPVGRKASRNLSGRDSIVEAQNVLSKMYDKLIPTLKLDMNKAGAQMDDVVKKYTTGDKSGMLGEGQKQQFAQLMNNMKTALTNNKSPQILKSIQSDWKKQVSNFKSSGDAVQRNMGDALEDGYNAFYRNIMNQNGKHAVELKNIDNAYSRLVVLEKAAKRSDGLINPSQLYNAATGGKISAVDRKLIARGQKNFQSLAEDAKKVIGDSTPDSGTAGRLATMGLMAGTLPQYINPIAAAGIIGGSSLYTKPGMSLFNRYITPRTGGLMTGLGEQLATKSPAATSLLNIRDNRYE